MAAKLFMVTFTSEQVVSWLQDKLTESNRAKLDSEQVKILNGKIYSLAGQALPLSELVWPASPPRN